MSLSTLKPKVKSKVKVQNSFENPRYILIDGPPRIGKSIIRKLLLEKNIAGFCTDSLVSMLMFAMPKSGINFEMPEYSRVLPYILGLLTYDNNYPLVLEGVGIDPKKWPEFEKLNQKYAEFDLEKLPKKSKNKQKNVFETVESEFESQFGNKFENGQNSLCQRIVMIVVGNCRISVSQKMQHIRQNPSLNEWTLGFSDLELENLCKGIIERSKRIEKDCQKYNLPFFDLSENWEKSVEKLVDFIVSLNSKNRI